MKSFRLIGLLLVFGLGACDKDSVSADKKPVDKPEGWQLVWSDDFTTNGLMADTDIYLGDSIGEMSLFLQMTEIAFVGRSLTASGGQNPLEPAMMGCAILSGGHVGNFRESYQMLARNGSARMVRDTEMLAKAVYYLITNEAARHTMIDAGLQTVHQMRGALQATLRGLEPYVNPLTMKARLMPRNGSMTGK